jgi:hypothetical protein
MPVEVAPGSERAGRPSAHRWVGWLLALGQCLLALSLIRDWLYVGTYRLYLDNRLEPGPSVPTLARQRFEIRGGRVEPQILSSEDERLAFPVDFPWPSQLRLRAVPSVQATVEIAIVEQGIRRTLLRRTLSEAAEILQRLPPTTGLLELANQGELRWTDPRVVTEPDMPPRLFGLLVLVALAGVRAGRPPPHAQALAPWARSALLGGLTAAIAVSLCLGVLEVGLRATGDHLPSWVTAQRRNLGEVHADPRWQESARYGPRLARSVHTSCEWQHGDIVRMGFLPPGLARHPAYRFPFVTDAEGFRNSGTEPAAPVVAALGDSFTDAMTLPAELNWPARLGSLLGVSVRNYGTAGFGPGQELRVLEEYALPRRPRWVVVGFFAGNDLQDAERFESFERDGGPFPSPAQGWKFKEVVARFDELYLMSLYEGAAGLLRDRNRDPAAPSPPQGFEDYSGEDQTASAITHPGFDRGLFRLPVGGRTLQFAFLPPYLNCLRLSREELQASRGWELTRRSFQKMERLVRSQGGELIVLFIPSKPQVYLPLLEASFPRAELRRALRFCLRDQPQPPEVEVIMRNRLALNHLMRGLCAEEGITFIDLTPELQSRVGAGHNVYFPDDSHWNAAGHETAAATLAKRLRGERL